VRILKRGFKMKFLGKETVADKNIYDCLIVGSGAAAYNAAVHLHDRGVRNFAIVTEDRVAGTSRNTGSDKQTYYKVACAGDEKDSPRAMAETLFAGGSMDGDLALCEASHSLEEFFHLVSLGVEFPHNRYGEFAGYKTDHDPLQRASSIGPYTSKKMTEQLEAAVMARGIRVIDKTRVIKILVNEKNNRAYGFLCLEAGSVFRVCFSKNIIFAAGGPPGLYKTTVYPPSQFGSSGILAREGVVFSNITEWQYGIGSTSFRWNLSGSYQQAIPRYVSVGADGGEDEFLKAYFSSIRNLSRAVFLKGYQWPFDPAKIANEGSSLVDLAIYRERHVKGKRVFLDYSRNPQGMGLDEIDETALEYLSKSGAMAPVPLERLLRLNPQAYELYKTNGIDLAKEYLEIDMLPQHHNGGAEVNIWRETSVKHLFAIGEAAGTHGVYRPGGSALNSGQVGGLRAASYIAGRALKDDGFFGLSTLEKMAGGELEKFEKELACNAGSGNSIGYSAAGEECSARETLRSVQEINSRSAAFIRSRSGIEKSREELQTLALRKINPHKNFGDFFRLKETLILSKLLHDGILSYIRDGGKSRGSYLVIDSLEEFEACLKGAEIDGLHRDKIINTMYVAEEDRAVSFWRQARPIPVSDTWFENVWREYREGTIFEL
jgi:succinate dehydrogenase/fumarate reductase flavoprotein subunit